MILRLEKKFLTVLDTELTITIFNQVVCTAKRFDEARYTFLSKKFCEKISLKTPQNIKKMLRRSPFRSV